MLKVTGKSNGFTVRFIQAYLIIWTRIIIGIIWYICTSWLTAQRQTQLQDSHYLLHGREMTLPNSDNLKAKISTENPDQNRLKNLQSSLKLAYQQVARANKKSYRILHSLFYTLEYILTFIFKDETLWLLAYPCVPKIFNRQSSIWWQLSTVNIGTTTLVIPLPYPP